MRSTLLSTLALAASIQVSGTVLTFNGDICALATTGVGAMTACVSGGYINQAYGDIASIDLSYIAGSGPTSLQRWRAIDDVGNFRYSDLVDVIFGTFGTTTSSIVLTPLGGASVTLNSFALGVLPNHVTRDAVVTVTDLVSNAVLFSMNLTAANGNPVGGIASIVSPGVSSLAGLRLTITTPDPSTLGLDNLNFTTSTVPSGIPEPSTFALLCAAIPFAMAITRRRRGSI